MEQRVAISILLVLCSGSSAQEPAGPPDHGAYYKTKDGWQKLELLTTTAAGFRAFSGITVSYRGVEAPVQLPDPRPVFYVKTTADKEAWMAVAARNMVIVLLKKGGSPRATDCKVRFIFGKGGS